MNNPIRFIDPDGMDTAQNTITLEPRRHSHGFPGSNQTERNENPVGAFIDDLTADIGNAVGIGPLIDDLFYNDNATTTDKVIDAVIVIISIPAPGKGGKAGEPSMTEPEMLYKPGTEIPLEAPSGASQSVNKLKPSSEATGAHSSFKVGQDGKITNTATYKQNPKNPSGFDEVKRVDVKGKAHDGVNTPHVHEPKKPVRPAKPEELPRQ